MNIEMQNKWENKAVIRTRPRLVFNKEDKGYFYPLSKQPLCFHPLIDTLGEKSREYILAQSLYKYSNDIATIETRVVNQAILEMLRKVNSIPFTDEQIICAYTVMVDEAYHAYVAFDAMLQIVEHTGVAHLPLPKTIEIEKAIEAVKQKLDPKYHKDFGLVAVCIAENTLTKEIIMMIDQEETHPFFQRMLKEHLSDESRHSGYFFNLLDYMWANFSEDTRLAISAILVEFLELYLGTSVQIDFEKRILAHIGLNSQDIERVISDIYEGMQLNAEHPMIKNIMLILTKARVIDENLKNQLSSKGWL